LVRRTEGRHQLEDLNIDGGILKWILKNRMGVELIPLTQCV